MSGDGEWGKAEVLDLLAEAGSLGAGLPAAPPADPDSPEFLQHLADTCPLNDAGNAARLLARHGQDLCYVEGVGWHTWSGAHWDGESGRRGAERLAAAAGAAFRAEVPFHFDTKPQQIEREAAGDYFKRVVKWAAQGGGNGVVRGMLTAAERSVCKPPPEMDADPRLFACANATLELRQTPDADGRLVAARAHDRADYVTHISPADYNPDADCPRWRQFVAEVQPDPEVRLWLQRFCGYLLSGLTSEQIVLCCEGAGANGKSIFWLAIRHVLGQHAAAIAPASFIRNDHRDGSAPSPDLARLPGKRLGLVSEWKRGQVLDEGSMKAWTGGDPITVRKLHREPFEFRPVIKLVFTWNNRPVVKAGDDGTWRRLRVLPWPVIIPKERRIQEDVLLGWFREEASGILNWLLDGWALWVERGLAPEPPVMTAVTAEFQGESDSIGLWLREACSLSGGHWEEASALYEHYAAWVKRDGNDPVSQKAFGVGLSERGFRKGRQPGSGRIMRLGVQPRHFAQDAQQSDDIGGY